MDGKTTFIVAFGGTFCGIGLIFLLVSLGIKNYIKKKIKTCTFETIGTIIDLKRRVSGSAGSVQTSYHPVIQYSTEYGKSIVKESSFGGSEARYKIGQTIRVFYDPSNPEEFYLPDDNIAKIVTLVFSLVGIGMIIIGAATAILVYIFA